MLFSPLKDIVDLYKKLKALTERVEKLEKSPKRKPESK